MRWFRRAPRCDHRWICLRAVNFRVKGGYIDPRDCIRTQLNWRCERCGATRVDDRRGTWRVEDFARGDARERTPDAAAISAEEHRRRAEEHVERARAIERDEGLRPGA